METPELYRPGPRAAPRQRPRAAVLRGYVLAAAWLAVPVHAAPACVDRGGRSPEARCESLAFGGRERTYRLYVPSRLAPAAPLLVALHGGGGGGASMEALTGRGFNRRADEVGALVVYPDGVDHAWNDGRHDLRTRSVRENVDDVGFLKALVAALAARYPVDPARVYVTGMSNGGMMTLRLACDASDVFAGFVAVAASLGADVATRCRPARVRPVALIDGTADPLVPYAGGEVRVLGAARGQVLGAERTFATFRALAGCSGVESDAPLDRVADDATTLALHRAVGCRDAARVVLYEIGGGGHSWPGGLRYARAWLIGTVSQELDATEATWRFLGLPGTRRGPV